MPDAHTLREYLPRAGEKLSRDEILSRFVTWATTAGFELYAAQEEAILELLDGKHVILTTPTGSGKSLVATFVHYAALCLGRVSFYTCPIKALANEKFFALCELFGAERVGMVTGDATINREAGILCCTAEVLSNLALRDPELRADDVVMDEFHYYADKERGVAWQVPLLTLTRANFLLMSATLGDTTPIEKSLEQLTERKVAVVGGLKRPVPLEYEYKETPLHETIGELVAKGRAPVYVVCFTQRTAAEEAQNVMSIDFLDKATKEAIKVELTDVRFSTPYGKEFQRFIRHGVGLHHAGLLPRYRLLVEKLAQKGLLRVLAGTDTLGMGINIPLRTVLFTQLCKYDGEKTAILSVRDFHQIAGRAGRKGFDDVGWVVAQAPAHVVENLKLQEKRAQGKKVVLQKPPEKGFVPWDRATFEKLQTQRPEPLESRFTVGHGMLLMLLQNPLGGYDRLVTLIARAHLSEGQKRREKKKAAQCFRSLRHAGIINVTRRPAPRQGATVEVAGDLQRDFSLHHTLSLYLIDTLARLDRAAPSYALDVLSCVESILENPHAILYAQLDAAKTQKMTEMKAAGVEYAERIEELDKLEWPKPLREFIYDSFNAFMARHPWVTGENIHPKSIARDMYERFASFADYVREYNLERSEGVLLRYLGQAYKALAQSVPMEMRSAEVGDVIAHLRLEIARVDTSLLDEWEGRLVGAEAVVRVGVAAAEAPPSRLTPARLRAELHRLLAALGRRRWAEALECLRQPAEATPWTAESLEAAMAPYFAEHAAVDLRPVARRPQLTLLGELAPGRWSAQQRIGDGKAEEGDDEDLATDWMLDCEATEGEGEGAPMLQLLAIRR